MRIVTSLALIGLLTFAAGCAGSQPGRENTYAREDRELAESCTARGGILVPTGQTTGRPALDNVCKINGAPIRSDR